MSRYPIADIRKTADYLDSFASGPMGRSAGMLRDYADTEEALAKHCADVRVDLKSYSPLVRDAAAVDKARLQLRGLWRHPLPQEPSGRTVTTYRPTVTPVKAIPNAPVGEPSGEEP